MSSIEKEKIFIELREYHTFQFPEHLASEQLADLRAEFEVLEDKIVNMILSLVNGKQEYVELKDELEEFKARIASADKVANDDTDRTFFLEKIDKLVGILAVAKESTFKLKPPRYRKEAEKPKA
jgi:chromosome segregation ATPase